VVAEVSARDKSRRLSVRAGKYFVRGRGPDVLLEGSFDAPAGDVTLDESTLITLERAIQRAAREFGEEPEDLDRLERWDAIISLVREADVRVDLRKPQNEYYRMKKMIRPVVAATAGNGSSNANRWLTRFDALGEKLSISPEARG